ncbi:MAG: hypothetical protein Q8P46_11615 [Hyphomicrobiales bacterium]|nr:hypothetical protein [Hyphomicrobiales bacterium]
MAGTFLAYLHKNKDPTAVAIKAQIHSLVPDSVFQLGYRLSNLVIGNLGVELSSLVVQATYSMNAVTYSREAESTGLPALDIQISGAAADKITSLRQQAVSAGQIRHTDDKWVPGKLYLSSPHETGWSKIKLRLKGDGVDHVVDPLKWSFRIESRSSVRFLGAEVFSIQHPVTRNGIYHFALQKEARELGILTPRTQPVRVRINNADVGIMMMEEHFLKEMVEAQRLREAPIIAFNEDYLWDQRWYVSHANKDLNLHHYGIKVFARSGRERNVTQEWHAENAVSLLRGYVAGNIPAERAFDTSQMADFLVLMAAWGSSHGLNFYNRRFHYSPLERRLFPVLFDPDARLLPGYFKIQFMDASLMEVPEFREAVFASIEKLRQRYSDTAFRRGLSDYAKKIADYARIDGKLYGETDAEKACMRWGSPCQIPFDSLLKNLDIFEQSVRRYIAGDMTAAGSVELNLGQPFKQLLAYWIPFADGRSAVEITNIADRQVTLTSLDFQTKSNRSSVPAPRTLGPGETVVLPVQGVEYYSKKDGVELAYMFDGQSKTIEAEKSYAPGKDVRPQYAHIVLAGAPGVRVDDAGKRVVFTNGAPIELESEIVVPESWRLVIDRGAEIRMRRGGLLRVEGDLDIRGTAAERVRVSVESHKDEYGREYWGGLLVYKGRLHMEHVDVTGDQSVPLHNRQDFRGLTGCVTVYKGEAVIRDVVYDDLQCEDALNVIDSPRTMIERSTFKNSAFDAFDGDFSTVVIRDTDFESTGNDAVDVSGSKLEIDGGSFRKIGDKGVSVGEESSAEIRNITVSDAQLGVVAKDKSDALVENASFEDIRQEVYSAYIKKAEYGPATITVKGSQIAEAASLYTREEGSRVVIDGKDMPPNQERTSHLPSLEDMLLERYQTN